MQLNLYEVWITDDAGNRLPQYGMEVWKPTRTATCFIPSESGKKFIVNYRDWGGAGDHHFGLNVKLDGREAGGNVCRPNDGGQRIGMRTTSQDCIEAYQFAELRTTEDATTHPAVALGSIEVTIERMRQSSVIRIPFRPQQFEALEAIDERNKSLAGTHCATLAPSKRVEKFHGLCKAKPLNPDARLPQVTFRFLYRPAALLQAKGIIPPTEAGPQIPVKPQPEKKRKRHTQGNPPNSQGTALAQGNTLAQKAAQPSGKNKKRRQRRAAAAKALTDVLNIPPNVKREDGFISAGWKPILPLAQTGLEMVCGKRVKSEEENMSPARKRVRLGVKPEPED